MTVMATEQHASIDSTKWTSLAARLLEQALGEARDGDDDAIISAETAAIALRAACGEVPETTMRDMAALLDDGDESVCTCPPDLVARGGFTSTCPAHTEATI